MKFLVNIFKWKNNKNISLFKKWNIKTFLFYNKLYLRQEGQISIITFSVLIIMIGMSLTMSFLIFLSQRNITNDIKSTQAYYAAEAGIEDVLLRLKKTPQITSLSYNMNIDNININVNVPNSIGISKTINSEANNSGIIKKIQSICSLDNTENINFYYGIQAGQGGISMANGSRVLGNVFSGGSITGFGTIDNNAIVSGNGNTISGVTIKGNAMSYNCSSANINGNLTYVIGGSNNCTVDGTISQQEEEISQQPLPIPNQQIDEWKNYATQSEVFSGNKIISGSQSLGPVKITGNLNLNNNATLTLTGAIYVQGNITFGNGVTVKLDSSYGSLGGVLITDGIIDMGTSNIFTGSGQTGSYILLISTNSSDTAIAVKNNSAGAVFYTTSGGLEISNNVSVTEATGYKIIMKNNAVIQYSTGLVNIYFASGPGAGWKVSSWQEQ